MKQHGIGEDAIKACRGQRQLQEILVPDLATGCGARHLDKAGRAVQPHRSMTQRGKRLQVAAGAAAQVQHVKRRFALDMPQQGGDVLADVVAACAGLEVHRVFFVVRQGQRGDLGQVFGIKFHGVIVPGSRIARCSIRERARLAACCSRCAITARGGRSVRY
ncbi:hypothetical protein D3C87_1527190 [compost metagenome]